MNVPPLSTAEGAQELFDQAEKPLWRIELPQVVRTVQKGTLAGTIEFYVERRRASGASPVFS